MSVSDNARDSSDSALDSGGTAVSLDHWIRARAEFEAQKSGDSDWADVTYVIS
jgi:hypothetical protein